MVAEPLSNAREPDLQARIGALRDEHAALWAETPAEMPVLGPRVGLPRHFANARAARRLIDELAVQLEHVPDEEAERRAWREAVRERLQRFGDERLGWPGGYRRLVFGGAFFAALGAFAPGCPSRASGKPCAPSGSATACRSSSPCRWR